MCSYFTGWYLNLSTLLEFWFDLLWYRGRDENNGLTDFSNNFQVTGGSSGIGKCIAIECYKQGAFITLIARDEVSVFVFLLATLY